MTQGTTNSVPPIGVIETPLDNATGVSGSIAVTGWAIDDAGLWGVRVLRDPVAGEPAGQLVFVGDAVRVDGARPDLVSAFPNYPDNSSGGWGYLLLTNMLPNQGNGTVRLHAYAYDVEGLATLLGTRTITCDNAHATKPFGAIDTPGQGETVGGTINNFGWVLSPGARYADPLHGGTVRVLVDGVNVGVPAGWVSRNDLLVFFDWTKYFGIFYALGVFSLDTRTLSNGAHTIAWLVTDSVGTTEGIGSRYFTVANRAALEAENPTTAGVAMAMASGVAGSDVIRARRGFDLEAPLHTVSPDATGVVTIVGEELDRFEVQLPAGTSSGHMRTLEGLVPLPIGSHLNPETGIFTWHPGVGFVGTYELVFTQGARIASCESCSIRREASVKRTPALGSRNASAGSTDLSAAAELAQGRGHAC